jgi:peptidoglycan hydrolase CwlO-like protein|uniref:Hemolysin XhlA n=1 Tax=Siphoviridae sp. ctwnj8 TaxID=2825734 RepID=A0A8S5U021_9CAUD|nr:MAG TPA: hemolysin XhlA [Siphoviridae sp. ctwnj8]
MTVELAVIISIISLGFGIYSGVANLKRNSRNDTKMDQSQLTTVIVKLENIGNDISEMKSDLRDAKEDLKNHSERLVKIEQQVKVLNNAIFGRKENKNEKD